MKALYKLLIVFILINMNSFAQTIAISNIDASNFPKVMSYISIMEYGGKSIDNIILDSLELIENGLNLSHTVELDCRDTVLDPPLSITLIVDRSNSMEEIPDGQSEPLKEWLKIGANAFIDALNFANGTKVELISFSTGVRLEVPFTSDKTLLKNKIDSMKFAGGTNYNPPFIDEDIGAIKRIGENTPPDIRRVIVFLTDGDPDGANATKNETIVNFALQNNIQIYCITLNRPMNQDLVYISSRTGGKAYPVYTKVELTSVYQTIANEIKTKKICKIIWESPYSCSNSYKLREVTLRYSPIDKEINSSYILPNSAYFISKIKNNPLYFDNPEIGSFTEKVLEITPKNSDLVISSYQFQPSTFFSIIDWDDDTPGIQSFKNMTIPKNKTQRIRLRFTPSQSQIFRKANFNIYAYPCNMTVELIGGLSQVIITSPENGELFSNCDKVTINWTGTDPEDSVNLYYKQEDNDNWILISSNIKANYYTWTPPFANQKYNFKVQANKPGIIEWVRTFGSTGTETINKMQVTYSGNNIFLIGNYNKPFVFQGNNMPYEGGKDAYVLNLDQDGNLIWAQSITGANDDLANDFCIDSSGNLYVTGRINNTSRIKDIFATGTATREYFAFIAKFNQLGDLIGTFFLDPTRDNPNLITNSRKISYNHTNKTITIWGNYSGEYFGKLNEKNNGIFQLTLNDALYDVKEFRESYTSFNTYSTFTVQDSSKNTYTSSSFTGTYTAAGDNYYSNGDSDIFLTKRGFPKLTNDTLQESIIVNTVDFNIKNNDIDFGSSIPGANNIKRIDAFIYNKGTIPVKILKTNLTNSSQFSVKEELTDYIINPTDSLRVTFNYYPTELGLAKSKFILDYQCHSSDTVNLLGYCICNYTADSAFNFNKGILNIPNTHTLTNVFTNNDIIPIEINPEIIGADKNSFKLISPIGKTIVPPKSSIDFEIQFTPNQEREYIAFIDYNANIECNKDSTLITGTGINGEILVDDLNFGSKRVKTININDINNNEAIIKINNPTNIPTVINQIKFEDDNSAQISGFEFAEKINLPFTIQANESYNLKIKFTPNSESNVSENVIVNIDGRSNDYKAKITGEGFIPRFDYEWVCPEPVYPGSVSFGQFQLKIHNSKSDLFIKEIKFEKGEASSYSILENTNNLNLSKKDIQIYTFTVKFAPNSSGMINDKIIITSDAVEGPDEFPTVDSIYSVNCEAKGNTFDNKLSFGKKILCSNSSESVTVKNTSLSTEINVINYELINNEENAFTFTSILPKNIKIDSEERFFIDFLPSEAKLYKATLKLTTDDMQILMIDLEGEGDLYQLNTNETLYTSEPNQKISIPLNANIFDFNQTKIDSVSFLLYFNETVLYPDAKNPFTNASGYESKWTVSRINNNTFKYTGIGEYQIPLNAELGKINLEVFLGDTNFTDILIQTLFNSCTSKYEFFSKVKMINICLSDERRVVFSNKQSKVNSIFPNPVQKSINMHYSLGLDAPVTIELFNELGDKVIILLNETLKAGDYSLNYPLNDLNSGIYYIKISQSVYTEIKKIIILQ